MDSIRVSEAPDPSSILGEATERFPACRQGFLSRLHLIPRQLRQGFLHIKFLQLSKCEVFEDIVAALSG